MKACSRCGVHKPFNAFPPEKRTEHGYAAACRECLNADAREKYAKDPSVRRSQKLFRNYGLSLVEYDLMLKKQGEACAICKTTDPGVRGIFFVDHCHTTQKVRGLLCDRCNRGIGFLQDDPVALRTAADYVEKHA